MKKVHEKEIGSLIKQNENENQKQKDKVSAQIESLKKDIVEEVKELFKKQNEEKLENLQEEIVLLKNEVIELKENLHAKTATNDHKIDPNDYQFNHECMIKEEVK